VEYDRITGWIRIYRVNKKLGLFYLSFLPVNPINPVILSILKKSPAKDGAVRFYD